MYGDIMCVFMCFFCEDLSVAVSYIENCNYDCADRRFVGGEIDFLRWEIMCV